jgi:protein arginine kinase activator
MILKKCFQCNKTTYTPYHVTEISKDKIVYCYDLCKKCGEGLMNVQKNEKIDLTHIKTPEQLLDFITGVVKNPPCPECGLKVEEFNVNGKFGCAECYNHFVENMQQLVFPYHRANVHFGKIPKKQMKELWNSTTEEKTKLLKLRLAKAIELEEYEKASLIKIDLDVLRQSLPSSSEGQ